MKLKIKLRSSDLIIYHAKATKCYWIGKAPQHSVEFLLCIVNRPGYSLLERGQT